MGTLPIVTVPIAASGVFVQSLDLGGLSGSQTLQLWVSDQAGNVTTQSYTVTLSTDGAGVSAPVLLARLVQDTGMAEDGWTSTSAIAGVVSNRTQVTGLFATLDSGTTAVFQDLTALLQADGTFTLDEDQLAALAGDGLPDGTYTLRLQAPTSTNQTLEQSVQFRLDRSAPRTLLPSLIDGISWTRDMRLQGTLQDTADTVQVSYDIQSEQTGQSILQRAFSLVASPTGTAFDQPLLDLADNTLLQPEEVYNLIVTSTDGAGNAERTRFQFFIPGPRRVSDDDPWTSPNHPLDPPTDERTPATVGTPSSGNVYSWGYVGSSGSWGYYGGAGSGTGGSSWTPGYTDGLTPQYKEQQQTATGGGYEYEYVEGLQRMVRQAVDLISTSPSTLHQKGALNNRQSILVELARRLNTLMYADGNYANDQALIDKMRPAINGLFADAYDSRGDKAGVYESFVPFASAWLAQQLVKDATAAENPISVREQIFQATLLGVVTEVLTTRQIAVSSAQQSALTEAVMALAKTYAWLNPTPDATVPTTGTPAGFLDDLWRLQIADANGLFKDSGLIAAALQRSVTGLSQWLDGVQDPVRAIQFINNLLQTGANVPTLKGDMKDARFLRELIEFGFEVAKVNPTGTDSVNSDEALAVFLNTLWQGKSAEVKQAQGGLSAFFAGLDTKDERIQMLDFADRLIDAAQLVSSLGTQKTDAKFLSYLTGLGSAYAALDPEPSAPGAEAQNENEDLSFLSRLWMSGSSQSLQIASNEIQSFLSGLTFGEQTKLLEYQHNVFDAIRRSLNEDNIIYANYSNELFTEEEIKTKELFASTSDLYRFNYGTFVENGIVKDYQVLHLNNAIYQNNYIKTILKMYETDLKMTRDITDGISKYQQTKRPDLFNYSRDFLYEIKNFKDAEQGLRQAGEYVSIFRKAGLDFVRRGPSTEGDPYLYGVVSAPDIGGSPSYAVYFSVTPGVILYKGVKNKDDSLPSLTATEVLNELEKAAKRYKVPLAVVILMVVISETSRAFPLRNLIPIP